MGGGTMKSVAVGLSLMALLIAPAWAQTAGEMLKACEIAQRGMHVEGPQVFLLPGTDVNQCWGFMEAVQEYSTLADQDGKRLLGACAPEDGRTTQVLQAFIDYARAHPEKMGLPAAAVAFNAMADAFPCKE
jgi:hypothetical protein